VTSKTIVRYQMPEFSKKKDCLDFCKEHNLVFFQRDLNANGNKLFVADTYENIFDDITKNGRDYWYESWNTNQPMKLYIDYDKKTPDNNSIIDSSVDGNNSHKTDIINIINTVRQLLPGITDCHILKSIPNIEKKSYHIVFDGIHFSKCSSIKIWMEEQLRPKFRELFDKNIIDLSVYTPKCLRSLLCSKYGQRRPLFLLETEAFMNEYQENPFTKDETTFEMFLKTCITNIEPESVLFNYKSEKKKDNSKKVHMMNDDDIFSDKEIIKKYLDILDCDRFTDRNKWLNIGYILYSIYVENKDLWHYFSSKWQHYDEDGADQAWDSFANSEYIYTVNHLIHLASIDNFEDCNELTKEIPNHDIKYLRPFDNILSKLIFRIYGEKFVCNNPKGNDWYHYNGVRWKRENKSATLRKKIINEIFQMIENYRRQLIREGASEDTIKNYYNILHKLSSGIPLNCLELEFYNENFDKIIDQNKDLLGFENGILDLKTFEFRKGISSDYVSMSTGYDYTLVEKSDPLYIELSDLICKILPDPEVRSFTMKSLASCLDGHNRDENFYIWSGKNATGGNGKSTLTDLMTSSLGEYACEPPVSLITGKRETANSANSALASIRNKRAVFMGEPPSNQMIQVDIMKSLTGGDKVSTRELHQSQIEFKPHAKFFLACNKIPSVSDLDGGVTRRLKITEFVSRFTDEISVVKEKTGTESTSDNDSESSEKVYEFQKDPDLKSRVDSGYYNTAFISILLHYYRIYREEGLIPPHQVVSVTKKYENNNNNIKSFIDENIIKGDKKDSITKEELKQAYKSDFNLRTNFPRFDKFQQQFENALCSDFKLDRKKISRLHGFCFRELGNDNSDDEIDP
jgi:P4 family phage/plasmid primase-like protien